MTVLLMCMPVTPGKIALSNFVVIWLALSVLILIYGSIKAYHSKDLSIHLKIIYYLTNIGFLCSAFGFNMATILPLTPACYNVFGVWAHLGHWGYGSAFAFFYILFLHRIRDTFKSTEYRVPIYLFIPLYSGFFAILISNALIAYYYTVGEWDKAHIAGLIYMSSNIFYSFCLLFLFTHKIYKLYSSIFKDKYINPMDVHMHDIKDVTTTKSTTNNDTTTKSTLELESTTVMINKQAKARTETINDDEEEDNIMDKLFQPLIKYTLSLTTCLITTILTGNFMNIYRGYVAGDSMDLIYIHHGLIVFDSFVNIVGLHLQFTYFSFLYNILCFPCNRRVRSLISRHLSQSRQKGEEIQEYAELPQIIKNKTSTTNSIND